MVALCLAKGLQLNQAFFGCRKEIADICDNCKQIIEDGGIFFIAVKDGESGNNPYRTGKISALKEEAVKRIFPDFPYKKINYIEDTVYNQIFNIN